MGGAAAVRTPAAPVRTATVGRTRPTVGTVAPFDFCLAAAATPVFHGAASVTAGVAAAPAAGEAGRSESRPPALPQGEAVLWLDLEMVGFSVVFTFAGSL